MAVCAAEVVAPPTSSGMRAVETASFHFLGDVHHLVERRRDQTAETDHVRAEFDGLVEDLVAGDHDAHVGDFEAVAGEHHADDVLADVMDVALDGGDEEATGGAAAFGEAQGLVVGQVADSPP